MLSVLQVETFWSWRTEFGCQTVRGKNKLSSLWKADLSNDLKPVFKRWKWFE